MLSLERARLRRGLSQEALAALVGVNLTTIWRIEKGRQRPYPRTRLAIANALGMRIEDIRELANGDEEPPADRSTGE